MIHFIHALFSLIIVIGLIYLTGFIYQKLVKFNSKFVKKDSKKESKENKKDKKEMKEIKDTKQPKATKLSKTSTLSKSSKLSKTSAFPSALDHIYLAPRITVIAANTKLPILAIIGIS